jgi:hypothetical protein
VAWILPPKAVKDRGRKVPQSLRVKPGAEHSVWKTHLKFEPVEVRAQQPEIKNDSFSMME